MQKNQETGESELYSLDEFSTRKGADIRKGYRECKIVCVNRYCMNLLYAPYWGKQR